MIMLYIGSISEDGKTLILKRTISTFLLDKNDEVIIENENKRCPALGTSPGILENFSFAASPVYLIMLSIMR